MVGMTNSPHIALITGANRGIGRATALELAGDGVDLIVTYRSHPEEAEQVAAEAQELGRKAVALQLDVGAIDTFDAFAGAVAGALKDTWGRETFDYLVNNGGMQIAKSFEDTSENDFDRLVDVQFKGVFFLTQRLAGLLADGGSIINVSSGVTRMYVPEHVAYAAAKGAVEVLTRYLAQELGPRGIRVNTVAPGPVATDFSGGLLRDNEPVQEMVNSRTALGGYAVAEDIGGAIASVLSDRNRWVNAQRIEVSGGLYL